MQEITIERTQFNAEGLDTALRAALGTNITGVSTRTGAVVVHLSDNASSAQIQQARQIVQNHDPSVLTQRQQRRQQMQQARTENAAPVNVADYAAQPALIRALVQKIAWLEMEMRQLNGAD